MPLSVSNNWEMYLETSKTSTRSQSRSRPARLLPGRNRRAWQTDQTWWCFLAKEEEKVRQKSLDVANILCEKDIHAVRHDQYSLWSTHGHQESQNMKKEWEPIEFVANNGSNRAKAHLLSVCVCPRWERKKDFLGWKDGDNGHGNDKMLAQRLALSHKNEKRQ